MRPAVNDPLLNDTGYQSRLEQKDTGSTPLRVVTWRWGTRCHGRFDSDGVTEARLFSPKFIFCDPYQQIKTLVYGKQFDC